MKGLAQWLQSCDRISARHHVLTTGLAVEIYRRRHGVYPPTLKVLVPDILPDIPQDEFAPLRTPLSYLNDGDSANVWSVGPDGINQGGEKDDIGFLQKYAR